VDDSLLLTACFDKRLRLWDVSTGQCIQRVQTPSFITACKFNQNGDFAVAGLYTGHCVFYQMTPVISGKSIMGMRYFTQIECRNKTGLQKKGRKVTRIRFLTIKSQEHMLVTTNESRCRLYNMDDFSLKCKYRGSLNSMLQIGASCSEDARHIICGSEDRHVVIWRVKNDLVKTIFGGQGKKVLCDTYESFRATDMGPVTVAAFAPERMMRMRNNAKSEISASHSKQSGEPELQADDMVGLSGVVVIVAGLDGVVGVFEGG
jgi:WD40 repeat protein